jgi:hypothetical protein
VPRLKGMPHPLPHLIRRLLLPLTVLAGVLALTAATTSTTPVYSGNGWKAETSQGIYSLSPEPYTIVFADETARDALTPYLTGPAAQVTTDVGVPITVTTLIDTTATTDCPSMHRIIVHYTYRPSGTTGFSRALPCYNTLDGSAWGGHILMDSEYWTTSSWFSTDTTKNESYRKNAATHELGHILGLDHPNYDKDKDGTVEPYECVTTSTGTRPLMCSPNGGYYNSIDAGKFTPPFDLPGLRQLLANYYARQTA